MSHLPNPAVTPTKESSIWDVIGLYSKWVNIFSFPFVWDEKSRTIRFCSIPSSKNVRYWRVVVIIALILHGFLTSLFLLVRELVIVKKETPLLNNFINSMCCAACAWSSCQLFTKTWYGTELAYGINQLEILRTQLSNRKLVAVKISKKMRNEISFQ